MKTMLTIVGAALAAVAVQAAPSADWISDSYSSFDVMLSGTGLGTGSDWYTIASPSGLWQLQSFYRIQYPVQGAGDVLLVNNHGIVGFTAQLPAQYPAADPLYGVSLWSVGFSDAFAPVAPINDGQGFDHRSYLAQGASSGSPYPYLDWSGGCRCAITSIPDVNDTSTWTWTEEFTGWGTSLEIPEPNAVALAGLGGVALLGNLRRTSRRPGSPKGGAVVR